MRFEPGNYSTCDQAVQYRDIPNLDCLSGLLVVNLRVAVVDAFPSETALDAAIQRHDTAVDESVENSVEGNLSATNSNHVVAELPKQRGESFSAGEK